MKRIAMSMLVPVLALAGCGQAPPPAPPAAGATQTAATPASLPANRSEVNAGWGAYGPLRLGVDAEQLRQSWPGALQGETVADGGCYYLTPTGSGDAAVRFMIEGDHFIRYDVRTASETAPGGGRAGMALGELQALYPQADPLQPHKYVEGGHYLRVPAPDGGQGVLVFEVDGDGQATAWRVGLPPQVDYVEGCS